MIRARGVGEVGLVASVAGRAIREAVGAGRTEGRVVALRALQGNVGAGQHKSRRRVIKRSARPISGGVAQGAIL